MLDLSNIADLVVLTFGHNGPIGCKMQVSADPLSWAERQDLTFRYGNQLVVSSYFLPIILCIITLYRREALDW